MRTLILIPAFCIMFLNCLEENPTSVVKKSFDPTNTIKKISHYNSAGELQNYLEFSYDEEGRKKELTHYTSQGTAIQSYALSYSGDNSIAKQDVIESSGGNEKVTGCHTFEYDSLGREVKMSFLDSTNACTEYYLNEYNDQGKLAKESLFSSGGILQKSYRYEYDANGVNTVTSCYLGSGELYSETKNEYDSQGRIVKESVSYNKRMMYYLTYEY